MKRVVGAAKPEDQVLVESKGSLYQSEYNGFFVLIICLKRASQNCFCDTIFFAPDTDSLYSVVP